MFEIVVLSGKGGTGKTSLTAAFAHLAREEVICDLDVDAPDLHLILEPKKIRSESFVAGREARIISEKCDGCGQCVKFCQFNAIALNESGSLARIDPQRCEGCKVCVALCPRSAVAFEPKHCGQWYESETRFGPLIHARLFPGEENSGKLVALLRRRARQMADQRELSLILSDGPPGIGCPVISSLSGADLAIIVTEPTLSGMHDLERVVKLCAHFGVPSRVIINKYDIDKSQTERIERFCLRKKIDVIGKLDHNDHVVHAMVRAATITEHLTDAFSTKVSKIWNRIMAAVIAEKEKTMEVFP